MALYQPTSDMANNAKLGLKMQTSAPISRRGGSARIQELNRLIINRQGLSLNQVLSLYQQLTRLQVYYLPGSDTAGTQEFLMLGGVEAQRWTTGILANLGEI